MKHLCFSTGVIQISILIWNAYFSLSSQFLLYISLIDYPFSLRNTVSQHCKSATHSLSGLLFDLSDTWTLDTVTQVVRQVVHNVQQEGEVSHVVHVDVIGIRSNGSQLILICVLYTWRLQNELKSILNETKDFRYIRTVHSFNL